MKTARPATVRKTLGQQTNPMIAAWWQWSKDAKVEQHIRSIRVCKFSRRRTWLGTAPEYKIFPYSRSKIYIHQTQVSTCKKGSTPDKVKWLCFPRFNILKIYDSQVSNESNVNPRTWAVLISGIIVSFKNKGGCREYWRVRTVLLVVTW